MQKLKILNTRDLKEIKNKLNEQFGFSEKLEKEHAFLLNQKDRIFMVNKDISQIDLEKLKVDKFGLYFGEWKNNELRLSMESAWLVGQKAKKNIVELNKEEVKEYFLGNDLTKDLGTEKKFVLLKYEKDVLGCAKYKEGKILNFLSKIHRSGDLII